MVVYGMTSITYRSVTDTIRCGSGFAKNRDRLELVRLLVEAEADPTFLPTSDYSGPCSSLASALDSCESYISDGYVVYQVRSRFILNKSFYYFQLTQN